MIALRESAGGTSFAVRVQPRAKRNAVAGVVGDALKIALTAPPVEGKANAACIEFLAALLNVPRASVTIIAGQASRNKTIRVTGVSARVVEARLQAAMPQSGDQGEAIDPGAALA
jgi:uncharacterized protein